MDFYMPANTTSALYGNMDSYTLANTATTSCVNNDISSKRHIIRILTKRYALTATSYKYLEIGVNVGTPSYVEIIIGDNRGLEMPLSLDTWKSLCEFRGNILSLLHNEFKNPHDFVSLGTLSARLRQMNGIDVLRFESANKYIMMVESTYLRMLDLDECITLAFNKLTAVLKIIDTKFVQFSNIASAAKNRDEVVSAIHASDCFDRNQIIDCELLALVFGAR